MSESDLLYWADIKGSPGLAHAWVSETSIEEVSPGTPGDPESGEGGSPAVTVTRERLHTLCGIPDSPTNNRWRERPKAKYCRECAGRLRA